MYRLTNDPNVVVRTEGWVTIPRGHRWWGDYEAWLAAGNTPEPLSPPGFDEVVSAVTHGVQAWMDGVARKKGYDNVFSCATYATSSVERFRSEAEAIVAWRDAVWTAAYEWRDGLNGELPTVLPTIEEVIAQLPQPEAFGWVA